MSTPFDPYHKWLGIPPDEQPPNHYRLLGLVVFESDADVIDAAAEARVAYLRSMQGGKNSAASQKLLNEVAASRIVLLNEEKRHAYDEHLRATTHDPLGPAPGAPVPGATMQGAPAPTAQPNAQSAAHAAPFAAAKQAPGIRAKRVHGRKKQQPKWMLPAVLCGGALIVLVVVGIVVAANFSAPAPQVASSDGQPTIPPRPMPPRPAPVDPPPVDPPPVDPAPVDPPPVDPSPVDPVEPAPPGKLPVPSDEEQKTTDAKMRTLFDFAAAKSPAQQTALASKLFSVADAPDVDPLQQYVLLDTAKDLARDGGDLAAAVRYIGKIDDVFEVDALQQEFNLIQKAAGEYRLAPEVDSLVKASQVFIQKAVSAGRMDLANDVAGEVYKTAARRGVAVATRKAAFDQRNQMRDVFTGWKAVQDAVEGLKSNPDDPSLNATAGRYYCFTQGDWQRGLACLAKSNDPTLQMAAKLEVENDGTAAQLAAAGDQWRQAAEKVDKEQHDKIMFRAVRAYLLAQAAAPPASDIATTLKATIDGFGEVTQVRNAIIRERRPDGKKILCMSFPGSERAAAVRACERYFLEVEFTSSMDMNKTDFSKYHTMMAGTNGMDYWGRKGRKEPEAFQHYEKFIRDGGHLVVFGTYNGRNCEHLSRFGIKTGFQHSTKFERNGEATDLFFRGAEHLVPENGKLRTAGHFKVSAPHTRLLLRKGNLPAVATLTVDQGRLTKTTCEPSWMGDQWLIEVMISWLANGAPVPQK